MRSTTLTIALVLTVAASVNAVQLKEKDNKVLAEMSLSPNVVSCE